MEISEQGKIGPDSAAVLSKSVLNAAKLLSFTQEELAHVLGVHRTVLHALNKTLLYNRIHSRESCLTKRKKLELKPFYLKSFWADKVPVKDSRF